MAIVFALCCLVFSALNDFVFKLYARKTRSRGMYVAVIGVVWSLLFLCCLSYDFSHWRVTLFWGIISGLFSVVANILLIEAMAMQDAGVCATIYRLNLVAVALGAFLLLDETLTMFKVVGVMLAVVAVFLFMPSLRHDKTKRRLGICLVVAAALLRAGMGLSYKYAFMNGADWSGLITITGFFWICGGIVYAGFRERIFAMPEKKSLSYGLLSGMLISGIVFFMAMALRYGDAGVVLPVAQMSFLGTFLLGAAILKEPITPRKIIGLIAGVLCVLIISA